MTAYDVHYYDRKGNHRVFCTYAENVMKARFTAEELIGSSLARITGIIPVDNFDW